MKYPKNNKMPEICEVSMELSESEKIAKKNIEEGKKLLNSLLITKKQWDALPEIKKDEKTKKVERP